MKYLLLFAIKLYQKTLSKVLRANCLFDESCSNFVYRTTNEKGFVEGLKAFVFRYQNCRSNYFVIKNNGKIHLITSKNEVIEEDKISKRIKLYNQ